MPRKFSAELIGTLILTSLGMGVVVLSGGANSIAGYTSAILTFGLTIAVSAYSIGTVPSVHLNPAVSITTYLNERIDSKELGTCTLGQVVGVPLGSFTLLVITDDNVTLGQNIVADGYSLATGFLVEVILTSVLILIILIVAPSRKDSAQPTGLAIGLALTLIRSVDIPVTDTSVNPARSLVPVLLAGGDALSQTWIFVLIPIVGGVLAFVVSQNLLETE